MYLLQGFCPLWVRRGSTCTAPPVSTPWWTSTRTWTMASAKASPSEPVSWSPLPWRFWTPLHLKSSVPPRCSWSPSPTFQRWEGVGRRRSAFVYSALNTFPLKHHHQRQRCHIDPQGDQAALNSWPYNRQSDATHRHCIGNMCSQLLIREIRCITYFASGHTYQLLSLLAAMEKWVLWEAQSLPAVLCVGCHSTVMEKLNLPLFSDDGVPSN